MVTVMQAVHCVSWEPLSGQDMRLVWRRRSMRNHKEVSTSLFRKSLCVRMRISSLIKVILRFPERPRKPDKSISRPSHMFGDAVKGNRDLSELRAELLFAVLLPAHRQHTRARGIVRRSPVLSGPETLEAAPSGTRETQQLRIVRLGKRPNLQVDRIQLTK